jgi:tetraprenyl-beta-curcumene synthase
MNRPAPLAREPRARAPLTGERTGGRNPFVDVRLTARVGLALARANGRYWSTVAPLVRARLAHWERRAGAIPDPELAGAALGKLREERFNVELAAMLATLAPRAHRTSASEAIVALQVMYDYLDLLTERPRSDAPCDGRRLFAALEHALAVERSPGGDYYRHHPRSDDGGYLAELVASSSAALARLPRAGAVAEIARRAAGRCAEAQVLSHAAAGSETAELERWARREAAGTGLRWPEYLAGASASVLAVHALIAAAADTRTTRGDAEALDAVYLSIGALSMLDSLVDRERDLATGEPGFLGRYASSEAMGARLASVATDAVARARTAPNGAHHIVTLVGIVAYYTSAPAGDDAFARPVTAPVRRALRPLFGPTRALMRAWRLAKRVRGG